MSEPASPPADAESPARYSLPGPGGNVDPGKERRARAGLPIVPSLDGFRALAVVGILLVHVMFFAGAGQRIAGTWIDDLMIYPRLGVDVLFVVSGFVMFLPTAARSGVFGNVGSFALRRAARLAPALWVVLAIVLVLIALAPPYELIYLPAGQLPMPSAFEIIGHFLLLQTPLQFIDLSFSRGLGIVGPVWTLSLELIFYALLPWIAGWWFRRPWLGLLIAAAISIGWHLGFANLYGITDMLGIEMSREQLTLTQISSDYQFPAYAFSFGAGMTAAWLYVHLWRSFDPRRLRLWASRLQPVLLLLVLVSGLLATRYGMADEPFVGPAAIGRNAPLVVVAFSAAVALLMVATAHARKAQQWPVANRGASWIADISYGIYLIHYPVLGYLLLVLALPQNGSLQTIGTWLGLTLVISIAWGWISAVAVERPARRWAQNRIAKRRGRESAAAT